MNKNLKNTLIIAIVVAVIFMIFLEFYINGNRNEDIIINSISQSDKQGYEDDNTKILKNCIYKHFKPVLENGYDYTQDMEYKDKIYHKSITNYDEYLIYKKRWDNICNMSKEDFNSKFMIITAVENTSMLGLTLSDIFVSNSILYIDLDEYKNNESQYNKDETCISIIIPNTLKSEDIQIRDVRKIKETPEYIYGWTNESTQGRTMITESEAVDIAKMYAKSLTNSSSLRGKYLQNYIKVFEVNTTKQKPNNYWLIQDGIIERQFLSASFERQVYEVILVREDDEMEIKRAYFYVDAYTGQVIGGGEMGD